MSQRNGDKSRFQINRKRVVLRRAKIRALVAAASCGPGSGRGLRLRRRSGGRSRPESKLAARGW